MTKETDELTDAQIRDAQNIVAGERALQQVRLGMAMGESLIPDAWQDSTEPRCGDCSRSLRPHKGHWTCCARGCPAYGLSQGDGAPEVDA